MSYNSDLQQNNASLLEILNKVNALPEAGGTTPAEPVLQEKSVTPTTSQQEVTPDSGYDGLSKVTVGAMQTAEQATPIVSVDSEGKITASATQSEGYVSAGTKSATKQLTTKAATTYTPGTADQTIAAGTYLTGKQTIKGDENLLPENIKKGVTIFGKVGTYEGSGGGSGGGSVETVTIHLRKGWSGLGSGQTQYVYYTDVNLNACAVDISDLIYNGTGETTIVVVKNTIIFSDGAFSENTDLPLLGFGLSHSVAIAAMNGTIGYY